MLHKHSSVFEVILNKILPQNNNDSNNNNDNKRARLYFHVIHLFIHSFFQILSNIFLRTTAFNTLKSIFFKKWFTLKTFFFLLASFNSISKTSGANTLFSIDWAPHRRPEIHVSRLFVGHVWLLGAGWDISQTSTDHTIYYNGAEVGGAGRRGHPRLSASPPHRYLHVQSCEYCRRTAAKTKKVCVLQTCGLCRLSCCHQ